MICDPRYDLSWRMFHEHLRRKCILLFLDGMSYKYQLRGFPGGAVVGSLPANAGDVGSSPGLGRSRMPRSSSAREPQLLGLCVWSLCSAARGAAMVGGPRTAMKSGPCTAMKSGPRLPQLEKALAQKRGPNRAIHTYIHTYIHKKKNVSRQE